MRSKTMKRKLTTKGRLHALARRADETDEHRRDQIARQLTLINRLLLLHKAMQTFMASLDGEVLEQWEAYLAHVTAEPCAICGDQMNHYGEPHGVVTGDGRTRADTQDGACQHCDGKGCKACDSALALAASAAEPSTDKD
jgi:hypothetical protein